MAWSATLALLLAACSGAPAASTDESASAEPASQAPASAGAPADEIGEHELVFAHIAPETFPYQDGALKLAELLAERSGGKITMEVFPAAQLGAERDIEEQILEGSIHFGVGAGALSAFSPVINVTELMFLIKNQEHMRAIVEGEAGELLAAAIEKESDFKVVTWFSTGNSPIQTVDRPITKPEDLDGLKIRVIENPALIDAFDALGANSTPLPFPEVYGALQTGLVDGAHLDWNAMASLKVYELVKYATHPDSAFLAEPRPIIASKAWWESLNDAERELIGGALEEAAAFERDLFTEQIDVAVQEAADAGVEFTEVDEQAFIDILRPVWEKWAQELDAADIIAAIEAVRP
jgi:tripartite ATP-independent transporter DctP family solute receptor